MRALDLIQLSINITHAREKIEGGVIADFQLPNADWLFSSIAIWQSEIDNWQWTGV